MDKDEKPKLWGVICSAKECSQRKAKKEDNGVSFHYHPVKNSMQQLVVIKSVKF